MVENTIRQVDGNVSYSDVVATKGKIVRAEPIAAAFERHRAHLVGDFPELESEMCSYVPCEKSPNRLDAAVWALTELVPDTGAWGLLELFSGTATEINARFEKAKAAYNATLVKIKAARAKDAAAAKPADAYPNCGGSNLWTGGGAGTRCADCGKQWNLPQVCVHYASRSEMSAASDSRGWPYSVGQKSWWEK